MTTPTKTKADSKTKADRKLPELDYEGDPIAGLRVPELRVANAALSRVLGRGVDVVHAAMAPTEDRWDALAYIGWVIAKRTDHEAQLGLWTSATTKQLSDALEYHPVAGATDDQDGEDKPPPTAEDLADQARQEGPTGTTG